MADDTEIFSIVLDAAGFGIGSAAVVAGFEAIKEMSSQVMDALGSFAEVGKTAVDSLGSLSEAGSAVTGILGPLAGAVGDTAGAMLSLVEAAGAAATALGATLATAILSVTDQTAKYALTLSDLSLTAGMSTQAAAGMIVDFGEVGGSVTTASMAVGFFQRGLELMAVTAEKAAGTGGGGLKAVEAAADATAAALQTAANQVADAGQTMQNQVTDNAAKVSQAESDMATAIQKATDNSATALETLAQNHADAVAKIQASIASLTSDFQTAQADAQSAYQDSLSTMAEAHDTALAAIEQRQADSLARSAQQAEASAQRTADTIAGINQSAGDKLADINTRKNDQIFDENQRHTDAMTALDEQLANAKPGQTAAIMEQIEKENQSHTEKLALINRTADEAEVVAKRTQAEALAKAAEQVQVASLTKQQDNTQQSIDAENQKYALQLEAAQKRYATQTESAQDAYDKRLAALDASLTTEDTKYQDNVTKEKARLATQVQSVKDAEAKKVQALEDSLAIQERDYQQHLDRIERAKEESLAKIAATEADATTGGGAGSGSTAKPTTFEVELRKILAAAGESATAIQATVDKVDAGMKDFGQIGLGPIADGFKNLYDQGIKSGNMLDLAGIAATLFGRTAGQELLPALIKGNQGFLDAQQKAKDYGLVLDDTGLRSSADFTAAQADMKFAMMGVENQIAIGLMPHLTNLFTSLADWLSNTDTKKWIKDNEDALSKWAHDKAWPDLKELLIDLQLWFQDHKTDIKTFFTDVAAAALVFGQWVVDHAPEIVKFLGDVSDWFDKHGDTIEAFWDGIQKAWKLAWDTIKFTVVDPIMLALLPFQTIWDVIHGDWKSAWDTIKSDFSMFFDDLTGFDFGTVWGGIASAAETAVNRIIDALDTLQFDIPGWVPVVGGDHFGFNIPHIGGGGGGSSSSWQTGGGNNLSSSTPSWETGAQTLTPAQMQAQGLATGSWKVPGTGFSDSVLAMLTPGEMVLPPDVANAVRTAATQPAQSRGGGATSVTFTGPVYISGPNPYQQGVDFGNGLQRALRSQGVA